MYFSLNLFRFINLVENSSLERRLIKGYVKRLRDEYLIKNIGLPCEITNRNFIPFNFVTLHFEKLSQMVGATRSSYEINRNLSRSDINSAAEMFMALNSCPSFYVKLYWKVIYGNESRMAKFASNIIRKAKDGFKALQYFSWIFVSMNFIIEIIFISAIRNRRSTSFKMNDLVKCLFPANYEYKVLKFIILWWTVLHQQERIAFQVGEMFKICRISWLLYICI